MATPFWIRSLFPQDVTRKPARKSKTTSPARRLAVTELEDRATPATFNVPADFSTIQAAVDAAAGSPGTDTIVVAAGTYAESVNVYTPVELRGANFGVAAGVDAGTRAAESIVNGGFAFTAGSSSSIVDGFRIEGGTMAFAAPDEYGVFLASGAAGITVRNNQIDGLNDMGRGILSAFGGGNDSITIQNNKLVNWFGGIFNQTNNGVQITGNLITDNGYAGISNDFVQNVSATGNRITGLTEGIGYFGTADGIPDVVASNNDLSGNVDAVLNYGGDPVNASGNWWGTSDPTAVEPLTNNPGGGATGPVDFTPLLNLGTDTGAAPGFQGDFSSLTVHTLGVQTGSTGRIQEGLNSLANGSLTGGARTVIAAAGTYREVVDINTPATLRGANFGNSAQGAANRAARVAPTVLAPLAAGDPVGLRVNSTAGGSTVDGFDFLGAGFVGGELAQVQVFAPNFTFRNNVSNSQLNDPFQVTVPPTLNAIGLLSGLGTNFSGLLVENSFFARQRTGVFLNPASVVTAITVQNNEFASRTGVNSDVSNSGQVWNSALVYTLSGNTLGQTTVDGLPFGPVTGINVGEVTSGMTVNVTNNSISTNSQGLRLVSVLSGGNVSVTGNTFTDHTNPATGLRSNAALGSNVTASGNTFRNALFVNNEGPAGLNLTNNTVNLGSGDFALSSATLSQLFGTADRVFDAIDVSTRGHVRLKAGNVYVTPNSFISPTTTSPSIQRGVNVAATGDTVNVAAGTFANNVVLDRQITLRGAQFGVDARGRVTGAPNPAVETVVAPASGIALDLQTGSNSSVIDGFAFVGSLSGATGVVGNSSGTNTGLQFVNNHVAVATGFTASALFMNRPAVEATFDKNVFLAATGSTQAVFFDGSDAFHGLYFTNNDVLRSGSLGGTGLFVDGNRNIGTTGGVRAPLVQGNLFQNHALGFNAGQRSFDDTQFVENTFTANTGGFAGGPLDSSIARNTFSNNSLYGIRLTAFGNTTDPTRGAQNTTVSNNVFTGNGTTVDLVNGYGDIRIDDQFDGTQSTNTIFNNSLSGPSFIYNRETNAETVNASGNWFGTNVLATIANGILGPAAANVDYTPYLNSGTDTSGTAGFQGDFSNLVVHPNGAQFGAAGRIAEAYTLLTATGTIQVRSGTYAGDVDLGAGPDKAVTLAAGSSPGRVVINGNLSLTSNDTLPIEVNGLNPLVPDYDNFVVNGTVSLGNASLPNPTGSYTPAAGDVFTIIANDGVDAVAGTFFGLPAGATVTLNGQTLRVFYTGNDGNDVILAQQNPTTVYVDDSWAGMSTGDFILDADLGTNGNQSAIFGYTAFSTVAASQTMLVSNGTIIVNGGTYAEAVVLAGTQTLEVTGPDAAQAVTFDSLATVAGQSVVLEGASSLTVGDATSTTVAGVVSGSGSLVKQGTGTLTLSGTNTYTGTTTVTAGTLAAASAAALGTTAAGTAVTAGTLDLQANIGTEPLSLAGIGVGGNGALVTSNGAGVSGGPVTLTDAATVGRNNLTVNGAVSGAFDLNTAGTGTLTFGGTITVASVTTNTDTGTVNLNGGSVQTTTAQAYRSPTRVGANTTFSSTGGGDIAFHDTLDGGFTVNVNTSGITTFGGQVGGTNALASLDTDAAGSTAVNGGLVKTTNGQTYGDAVTVGADTTFRSTGTGNIAFNGTLNGAFNVTVTTGGAVSFGGAVGGNAALASLSVPLATNVTLAAVTTTGDVLVGTLTGPFDAPTVASGVTGTVTLNGPVQSGSAGQVLLATTKGVAVNANVTGGGGGVTVSANRQATPTAGVLNGVAVVGATVTTTGTGAVRLAGTATTANGAGVLVRGGDGGVPGPTPATVSTGGAGSVSLVGTATGAGGLGVLVQGGNGNGGIGAAPGATATVSSGGAGGVGIDGTATASDGVGVLVRGGSGGTVNSGGGAVSVTSGGGNVGIVGRGRNGVQVQGGGANFVAAPGAASVLSGGAGSVSITGTSVSAGGAGVLLQGGGGSVTNTGGQANVTSGGAGGVSVSGITTTNSAGLQTVRPFGGTSGTAVLTSGGGNLSITVQGGGGNPALSVGGQTQVTTSTNGGDISVSTNPGQNDIISVSGTLSARGNLTVATGDGNDAINFNSGSSVTSAGNGTVSVDGGAGTDSISTVAISTTGDLLLTAETVTLNGSLSTDAVTAGETAGTEAAGNLTVTGAVVLGGNVTLDTDAPAGDGNILITGTVDATTGGGQSLTLTADTGTIGVAGSIGGTTRLSSLTTTTGTGLATLDGAAVRTTGGQTFNTPVAVSAAAVAFDSDGSGNIGFSGTLNGTAAGVSAVTVTTGGTTTFGGAVGGTAALLSLTTNAGGTTAVNGGQVRTTGFQTYGDAVSVGAGTVFQSTGTGNITFSNTLNGAFDVQVTTGGNATFTGAVGNMIPLDLLIVAAADVNAADIATVLGLSVNNTGTASTISGAVTGTGATFIKLGTGTLNLTGNSTYDGTTSVLAGVLLVNGNNTDANGAVTVADGAVLGGSGTSGGAVSNSGTVAPGATFSPASTAIFTVAAADLAAATGDAFEVQLNGTTAGTQYDRLNVTSTAAGAADVGGATLSLRLGTPSAPFAPAPYDRFDIVTAGSPVTGLFDTITSPDGTVTAVSGFPALGQHGSVFDAPLAGGGTARFILLYNFTPLGQPTFNGVSLYRYDVVQLNSIARTTVNDTDATAVPFLTSRNQVTYQVVFNTPVRNLTPNTFVAQMATGAWGDTIMAGDTVTAVTPVGPPTVISGQNVWTTWTVTVDTGMGSGQRYIEVAAPATGSTFLQDVTDAIGIGVTYDTDVDDVVNDEVGNGGYIAQRYDVDKVAPRVVKYELLYGTDTADPSGFRKVDLASARLAAATGGVFSTTALSALPWAIKAVRATFSENVTTRFSQDPTSGDPTFRTLGSTTTPGNGNGLTVTTLAGSAAGFTLAEPTATFGYNAGAEETLTWTFASPVLLADLLLDLDAGNFAVRDPAGNKVRASNGLQTNPDGMTTGGQFAADTTGVGEKQTLQIPGTTGAANQRAYTIATEYRVAIVLGDVNGDRRVNSTDFVLTRNVRLASPGGVPNFPTGTSGILPQYNVYRTNGTTPEFNSADLSYFDVTGDWAITATTTPSLGDENTVQARMATGIPLYLSGPPVVEPPSGP